MFARPWILALAVCVAIGASAHGQPANSAARIESLIRKLGSASFVNREQARLELEAIGTPALALLRNAKKTGDAETNKRIAELIGRFETQILTQQILAPKEMNLGIKDVGVLQAIADLASQSGYPVQFQGDATTFIDKKITLEGKMPFWQALDKLCDQAGLMQRLESVAPANPPGAFFQGGKKLGGIRRIQQFPPPAAPSGGPIVLVNRGNEKSMVSHAGAVKTEVRISRDPATKELLVDFITSVEPRLLNSMVVGGPLLEKAFTDSGHPLQPSVDAPKMDPKIELEPFSGIMPTPETNGRVAKIRLKNSDPAAKALKELAGNVTLQLDLQNEVLAKLGNVMESAGKTADAVNGGRLKVQSIKKLPDGHIEAQVSVENVGGNPFGGNIIVNGNGGVVIRGNVIINGGGIVIGPNGVRVNGGGNGNANDLPNLVDAKGQKFKTVGVSNDSFNISNGTTSRTATILFQAVPGQVEPSELVLFGSRTHTIAVPFRFENVPLP